VPLDVKPKAQYDGALMQGSNAIMQRSAPARVRVPYMVLALAAGAWFAGIAAAATFGDGAWPLAIAAVLAGVALAMVRRSAAVAAYALLLPLIFAAGIAREHASHHPLPDDAAAHFNGGVAMRIRGALRDDPEIGDTSQRFAISVRKIQRDGAWAGASGGVLVRGPLLPRYRSGDIVELEGKIEAPPRLEDFDYAAHLARRGIASVMEYPRTRIIGHDDDNVARTTILRARRALSQGLALALPEPHASLAQGVLLGERSALPSDLRDDLNTTNTSHLVVVSGSNVVLVAGFCTLIFGWFVRRRQAALLSIAAVLAYAALVGLSPPVLRATIMGIVLITAGISGRRTNGVTSLLLAAAIMAGWQPSVVRDVSFQLSFSATAGILYLSSPLRRWIVDALGWTLRRAELPRWVNPLFAEPASVTVAAMLATTPLLALNFGRVSLVSLPANLLIVPAFPFILLTSLVAAVGGAIPHAHLIAGAPAYALLTYWLRVTAWFASLPGAATTLDGYTTPYAIATYAAVTALAIWIPRATARGGLTQLAPSRPMRWRTAAHRALFLAPAALLAASAGWLASGPSQARRLEVTVLDVGQGDAILIETPGGRDVLIDGGPGRAVLRGLGREMAWRDRSIDLVVVTHAQADHATGLLDVLDRYDVRRIVAGPPPADNSLVERALTRAASGEGAAIERFAAGTSFDLGGGVRLDVLSPPAHADGASGNDASIVLRLVWRDVSFLLTGDIEANAEKALVESGIDLRATVLKIAHHGSKTSSTAAFLDAVRPPVAVISSGAKNRFGHPAPDVVDRLGEYADIYNTADDGAVHFETDGQRLWIETER
jgi:competence protein ComEC